MVGRRGCCCLGAVDQGRVGARTKRAGLYSSDIRYSPIPTGVDGAGGSGGHWCGGGSGLQERVLLPGR